MPSATPALYRLALVGNVAAQLTAAQTRDDPCHALSIHQSSKFPESFVRPSDVQRCMQRIPMNVTAADDLINGTLSMLDIYSYQYYAIDDANTQMPEKVNLRSELDSMRQNLKQFKSMPDFARKVGRLFGELYDGHTGVQIDCADRISFDAFLPLANLAPTALSPSEIVVHPDYEQFLLDRNINKTEQFSVHRSIAGAKLLQIDGEDAHKYLTDLASNSSVFFGNIDPETRFNQLFVNLRGHPTPRLGYGVALTSLTRSHVDKDTLRVKVAFGNGTRLEVSLPWLGAVDSDYHKVKDHISFENYYSKYVCMQNNASELMPKNDTKGDSQSRSRMSLEDIPSERRVQTLLYDSERELVQAAPAPTMDAFNSRVSIFSPNGTILPSSKTAPPKPGSQLERIANVDSGFQIYHFKNTTVGVIYYTNFSDDDEEKQSAVHRGPGYVAKYRKEMQRGLKALKARGVEHLMIEVSGNNGGRTELGSLAMLSLFPSQYPGFGTVYRSNPDVYDYLDGSDYEKGFCGIDGVVYKNLTGFLSDRNSTLTVNGVNASYTRLTVDNLKDPENWPIIAGAKFPSKDLFSPDKMLIITNGKCASTCAQVTMYLQDVHGIKSVGFGGTPSRASQLQTVGGVRGAQVVEMLDPHDPAGNMYNFSMRVTQMTINFRSAIHYEKRVPTEYVTRNVDHSYQHTLETFNSFERTWKFVADTHFGDGMKTEPVSMGNDTSVTWSGLSEYPDGWFDRLQVLERAMNGDREKSYPEILSSLG